MILNIDKKQLLSLAVVTMLAGCGSDSSTTASTTTDTDTTTTLLMYTVVDTNQVKCFDSSGLAVTCSGTKQDAEYLMNTPSYTSNGDGTVSDNNTNLMWQQTADRDGDGEVLATDKLSQDAAISYCQDLTLASYSDWRLPDIKTIYSLMDFTGRDPSGETSTDTSELDPFINDDIFGFGYGDTASGERLIDGQWATTTNYVANSEMMFGLNLSDGRIKGYELDFMGSDKTFYVQCVRGNEEYGKNNFVDNNDSTITDDATGLMWHKDDNLEETNWDDAIAYCEDSELAGYTDWKLPDAKELHSIVDYSRSPDTTNSPAINEMFNSTSITNEAGESDYGFYWSNTTHASSNETGSAGAYVSFGRALGYMDGEWYDAHGAGCQRSDPKDISLVDTTDTQYTIVNGTITHGPQGDVLRGLNFSRCVRKIN